MLKYIDTKVVMTEVPDEITLAINISGCPCKCKGCHSPWLWEDKGTDLTREELLRLIRNNEGITCVSFMGGDSDPSHIVFLAGIVKRFTNLKVCWYSGFEKLSDEVRRWLRLFDYVKVGPYIEELGGLDSPTTNQKFFKVTSYGREDITHIFQKHNKYNETED